MRIKDGYLQSIEELKKVSPKLPHSWRLDESKFETRDQAFANVLSACARRTLANDYFAECVGGHRNAHKTPLQLWILGYPEHSEAKYASWFEGEDPDSNYRVIVHHIFNPISNGCYRLGDVRSVWPATYTNAKQRGLKFCSKFLKAPQMDKEIKAASKQTLVELLAAMTDNPNGFESVIGSLGHPVVRGSYDVDHLKAPE